jgi:ABC-2 type transport system permease protein
MGNAFRRSPWQVFGLVLGVAYGVVTVVLVIGALVAARVAPVVADVHSVLVVIGSIVVAGFLLLPLVFGIDDTLDPRKFALFGIPDRRLALALGLSGLIGIPAIVLFVCALATVITWSRHPGAAFLAVLSAIIVVPTCVLASRISTAIASLFVSPRRSKEAGGVVAILVLVLVAPVLALLLTVDWGRDGLGTLSGFAGWLQWTPLGAVWSMPGAAADGAGGAAFVQLLIAVATVGVLWLVWRALVSLVVVAPERESQVREHHGLGWFGRLPGGPTAAVAARSMTYWGRDARYWVALVTIPVIPVCVIVALTLGGNPLHLAALVPLPLVCLFLGWTIHNDVAFDSTAIWLHLVSGTRGFADRLGRMFPPVLVGIPVIAIGSVVTTAVFGDWAVLPAIAALCGSILVIGLGLSSMFSVLFPYPATKPGDSAFTQPQTSGASSALAQALSFFAIVILASPAIVFLALGLTVNPFWLGVSPVVSVLVGFAAFGGGVWAGSRLFDKRGPELMAFANRND